MDQLSHYKYIMSDDFKSSFERELKRIFDDINKNWVVGYKTETREIKETVRVYGHKEDIDYTEFDTVEPIELNDIL